MIRAIETGKKRNYSNSIGNKHLTTVQNRIAQRDADKFNQLNPFADLISSEDIILTVNKTVKCCSKFKEGDTRTCLRRAFTIAGSNDLDLVKATSCFREARQEKGVKIGKQLDHFIQEKYRSIKTFEKIKSDGSVEFQCNWSYTFRNGESFPLCRQTYSDLYGIPKNSFDNCSAALKGSETRRVDTINHKVWTDSHITKNLSFLEMEDIFKHEFKLQVIGQYILDEIIDVKSILLDILLFHQRKRGFVQHYFHLLKSRCVQVFGWTSTFRNMATKHRTSKKST